jgi:hypothetical protein
LYLSGFIDFDDFLVGVPLEVFTRALCFLLHTVVIYLFDGGIAFSQLRVMVLLWLNSLYHACSVAVNPASTFLLIAIITIEPFRSIERQLFLNTD